MECSKSAADRVMSRWWCLERLFRIHEIPETCLGYLPDTGKRAKAWYHRPKEKRPDLQAPPSSKIVKLINVSDLVTDSAFWRGDFNLVTQFPSQNRLSHGRAGGDLFGQGVGFARVDQRPLKDFTGGDVLKL